MNTKPCPNCGSRAYVNTVALEYCPDCGIKCCYRGGGSNAAYDAYCKKSEDDED